MGTARLSAFRGYFAPYWCASRGMVLEAGNQPERLRAEVTVTARRDEDRSFLHSSVLREGTHRRRIDRRRDAEGRADDAAHHSTRRVGSPAPSACPLYSAKQ